ncbi:MAG: hypothetical protein JWQ82_1614 [Tardiphaga sp.]|nr:hypothetical protein [Tardiphaga sp.]
MSQANRPAEMPFRAMEPAARHDVLTATFTMEADMGRGLLLWLVGVPIPVILLLWLFFR